MMQQGYYQGGYGQYPMHYGWGFPSITEMFFIVFLAVLFVDAVLLGIWLWKHLKK